MALVPGIHPQNPHRYSYLWLAVIFGLVNALIRPIFKLISLPIIVLTLGLFVWVINATMFALAGWIGSHFGVGFTVSGFWSALLGSIITSVTASLLTALFKDELEKDEKQEPCPKA